MGQEQKFRKPGEGNSTSKAKKVTGVEGSGLAAKLQAGIAAAKATAATVQAQSKKVERSYRGCGCGS